MNEYEQSHEYQNQGASPPPPLRSREPKSAVVAGLLSGMPGVGHIYVGYYRRGFAHFAIFATTIFLLAQPGMGDFAPLFGPFLGFFWFYNLIDAVRRAHAYNRAAVHGDVADDFLPPDTGFGPTAGVILIVVGTLLFMRTKLDMDFYWLEEWWPLGLVLLGINIVWRHRRGARSD